jgi:serine/threonine protein kinase
MGVVHRDVKPDNFLLSRDVGDHWARVVICDFGLSTIIDSTKRITPRAEAYVGTTSYKAPEIVKEACQVKWSKKVFFVFLKVLFSCSYCTYNIANEVTTPSKRNVILNTN